MLKFVVKRVFVEVFFMLLGFCSYAQFDFCDTSNSNHLLYYKIHGNSVRLVAPGNGYPYFGYNRPTGDVVVPDTVSFMGVDYPVSTIAENAFISCSRVTSVHIPHTVENIMTNAFNGCIGLEELYVDPVVPPSIQNNTVFTSVPFDITVWVPAASYPLYCLSDGWNRFVDIRSVVDSSLGYHMVTVASMDTSKGSVVGSGVYAYGSTVDLYALSRFNIRFMGWNDGNLDNPRRIAVASDSVFTALFSDTDTVYIVDSVWVYDTVCVGGNSVSEMPLPWVWVDGLDLVVMESAGLSVTVYDLMGRVVGYVERSFLVNNTPLRIPVPCNGVYVVRVGAMASVKVVVG